MRTFKQHILNENVTKAQGQGLRKYIRELKGAQRAYAIDCFNTLIEPSATLDDLKSVPVPTGLKPQAAQSVRTWFKSIIRPRTDNDWLPGMETINKFLQGTGASLDTQPIEEGYAPYECQKCGKKYHTSSQFPKCPKCGEEDDVFTPPGEKKKGAKNESINEAFTRQHYEAIARVIHDEAVRHYGDPGVEDALYTVAKALSNLFKDDNPRFDPGAFITKCGV